MMKNDLLIGFFSISADGVMSSDRKRDNAILGPAIRIYMLAIDNRYKHKRIQLDDGTGITYAHFMLEKCIETIQNIVNKNIGAELVTINSTEDGLHLYINAGKFERVEEYDAILLTTDSDEKLTSLIRLIFPE